MLIKFAPNSGRPAHCRSHDQLMQCCGAFDISHGHADGEMTLEKSHALMLVWSQCQNDLDGLSSSQLLQSALADFREQFFLKMQEGFQNKCVSIKNNMISVIKDVIDNAPPTTSEKWGAFKTNIEDFQRLGTADMFSEQDKSEMKEFAHAAETFRICVFNSGWATLFLIFVCLRAVSFCLELKLIDSIPTSFH